MMGFCIVGKLLLMTLLLQPTEEKLETQTTSEPENSVRFGEFCLRISDGSHWTSSKPVTQLPTKPADPTKHATQLPKQPTQPTKEAPKLTKEPIRQPKQPTQLPTKSAHPTNDITQLPKQPTQQTMQAPSKEPTQLPQNPTQSTKQAPKLPKKPTKPPQNPTQPTKQTPKQPIKPPQKPTQSNRLLTQQPTILPTPTYRQQSNQTGLSILIGDIVSPAEAPLVSHEVNSTRCRCNENNMKQPTETSPVLSTTIWPSSERCPVELIERLMNGREVCVNAISVRRMLTQLSLRSEPTTEAGSNDEPSIMTTPPPDPTTELPPSIQNKATLIMKDEDSYLWDESSHVCETCNRRIWNNVDPKSIQSLNVKMKSFLCPVYIYVSLKEEEGFCVDSLQLYFITMLEMLKISPFREDQFDHTQKNIIDGCRCKNRKKKQSSETSSVKSAVIWPLSERCSSTEYIETLENGMEVCANASSISAYLVLALVHQSKTATETGRKSSQISLHNNHAIRGDALIEVQDERTLTKKEPTFQVSPALKVREPCLNCSMQISNNIDQKDIESLQMKVRSLDCPVIFDVTLKNKESFCVDSSQPWFRVVLEILETDAS